MGNKKLTKAEARELITPIVDNEATAEEREAFMNFIARHEDVKREYESMKQLKALICNRCPCAKAPESLKSFLSSISKFESFDENAPPIYDIPCAVSVSQQPASEQQIQANKQKKLWFYTAATVVLLMAVLWVFNFWGYPTRNATYNIEEYVYQHFIKNNGKLVPPTISTASLGVAENRIQKDYDMPVTVPELKRAEFKGVVYDDFVPNFKAPMLEYYLSPEDQYIYIFAFHIDKVEEFGKLIRDQEAVKTCTKPNDFYIKEINGKHVVSWKWNNVWYTAISNHDGNIVASLVEPLDYEPTKD